MFLNQSSRHASFVVLVLFGLASAPARGFDIEIGNVTVQDTFGPSLATNVSFIEAFATTPIVISLATNEGGDPSALRITNVTPSGFTIVATEPDANDGPHVAMTTAYLAIEPGDHMLPNGSRIQAYLLPTTASVGRFTGTSWASLGFTTGFSGTPAVLAALQTDRNESANPPSTSSIPFLATAIQNVTSSGLQYALERAETTAGSISLSESVGIVAISSAIDLTFFDTSGIATRLQSFRSGSTIRGFDDGCFPVTWPSAFANTPLAIASMNTRAGNNGGWLRRCSQTSSALGLAVEEDIDNDSERNHTNEAAGMVASNRAFHASFAPELEVVVDVSTLSDPVNGASQPFSIPGALVQYTLIVSNQGNGVPDTDSVTVTDIIQDDYALCVAAACQAGGPVTLDSSLSPLPANVTLGLVRYSNDAGSTFSYTPVPDADGFDENVDAVEVTLNGDFSAVGNAGAPSVRVLLSARLH